jgi:hypothetical protein
MPEKFSKETLQILHAADSAIRRSRQLLAERDELIGVAKAFVSSRARPLHDDAGFLAAFYSEQ